MSLSLLKQRLREYGITPPRLIKKDLEIFAEEAIRYCNVNYKLYNMNVNFRLEFERFQVPELQVGEWCNIYGEMINPKRLRRELSANGFVITRCICPGGSLKIKDIILNYGRKLIGKDDSIPSYKGIVKNVSMVPRSYLSEEELEKKRMWYEKGITTGHWNYGPFCKPSPQPKGSIKLKPCSHDPRKSTPYKEYLIRKLSGF